MKSNILYFIFSFILLFLSFVLVSKARAEILSTSDVGSADVLGGTTQNVYGQSFLISTTENYKVNYVHTKLKKSSSPTDEVLAEIRTDSSGSPSNTVVATSRKIFGSQLTTSFQDVEFYFPTMPELTTGTTYWLILKRSGSANGTNNYSLYYDSNVYADGVLKYSSTGTGSWATSNIGNVDLAIEIFYQENITAGGGGGFCYC